MERCTLAPPAALILRRQWDRSAKGESSPCRISLLNPLLWLAPSQPRKGTKFPGRLWQAAPLSAGQKLIPSSFPVPPAQGPGLARLAFRVSLSGGVKGREQESRGWSYHPCCSPDRQTDALFRARPHPEPQHQALVGRTRGRRAASGVCSPHVEMGVTLTTVRPGHQGL